MNKKFQTIKYIISDFLSALITWVIFFIFRKITIENGNFNDINKVFDDNNFYLGIIFIPVFWVLLYWIQGYYYNIYKKGRLKDLSQTMIISLIGVITIFFVFLLDDHIGTYRNYYLTFAILFLIHFSLTYIPRFILTTITVHKVHNHKIGFPTLMIISDEEKAIQCYNELNNQIISSGNKFVGYITLNDNVALKSFEGKIPFLGNISNLSNIINEYKIEEVIIVLKEQDENQIYNIILKIQEPHIEMFIPADRKDILIGSVRLTAIFHTPLVQISQQPMENWEFFIKRVFDIITSLIAILILSPIYIAIAIIVKTTSKGNIFYRQIRIGKNGKPFYMYKFRSMYTDAEKNGPMLSNGDNDDRITPFGHFMRKVRLDEIPQFYNVLIGNMSMVGYRPERKYFIDKIVEFAPEYRLLYKIKPGMTSWGQVKFGYADKVEQMVDRLKYDLLYLENMSMATDIKILLYTFIIILQGRGK